ncbi:MAG: hypothetical protein L0Y79_07385 [Chlorobi bacterium]|nr:hypothetical protein [Chlorobiota bacterium]
MGDKFSLKIKLAVIVILLSASGLVYGQRTQIKRYMLLRSSPKYTVQFSLNYNQAVLELSGTYNDDVRSEYIYDGQTFGADKGYGASVISKMSLTNRGDIRFIQSLTYNRLLSYTFGDKTTLADDGKATYNCFTGALGLEYNFTPGHRYKIFLAAELNASMINGHAKIWFENRGIGEPYVEEYDILNSFRMGYGFLVGSEYLIANDLGLNIGARFTNANALFRQAEGNNSDREFKLRDADNPNLKFAGNKNFSFYSIVLGIGYYFGVKEKKYKLN